MLRSQPLLYLFYLCYCTSIVGGICTQRPLLIVAHADDEVLFGHPILATAGSCRPHVVLITLPNQLTTRNTNFLQAATELNFTHESLGYSDGPEHHGFDQDSILLARLSEIISLTTWKSIYTHGPTGEYGHPQHIQCSHVVSKIAWQLEKEAAYQNRPTLYYFSPYIDTTIISKAHEMVSSIYSSSAVVTDCFGK